VHKINLQFKTQQEIQRAEQVINTMVCFEQQQLAQSTKKTPPHHGKKQSAVVKVDELAKEVNSYLNSSSD
jgi:hypothetical protein